MRKKNTALEKAANKQGSITAFAKLVGVKPPIVHEWIAGKRPVPHKHCPRVEAVSGIHCEVLRPEVVWRRDEFGRVTHYEIAV